MCSLQVQKQEFVLKSQRIYYGEPAVQVLGESFLIAVHRSKSVFVELLIFSACLAYVAGLFAYLVGPAAALKAVQNVRS